MDYRSILVQVDAELGVEARIAAAARISSINNAVLSAVVLKSDYTGPSGVMPAAASDAWFTSQRRKMAEGSKAVRLGFDRSVRDVGVEATWTELSDDFENDLVVHVRLHDLVVVPRKLHSMDGKFAMSAGRLGLACGGPVLVLSDGAFPATFGRKIILAWKDSREAARVLRDAGPFLQRAEGVYVVTALCEGSRCADALLERQLLRYGCKSLRFITERNTDRPAGELISQHIDLLGADMVVLGLFGHARVNECVLGGVSEHMLHHSPASLLVSH